MPERANLVGSGTTRRDPLWSWSRQRPAVIPTAAPGLPSRRTT